MTESKLPRKRAPGKVAAVTSPLEWEYAPAPESRDVVRLQERYGLFVGGEQVEPLSGEWYSTIAPATAVPCRSRRKAAVSSSTKLAD